MKLYPKQLRSMDDLRRERRALQRDLKQMDKEDFLSVEGLLNKKGKGGGGDVLDTIIDVLPVSNPLVKTGIGIVKDVLKKRNTKAKTAEKEVPQKKKGPSIAARAAREFIGGYVKWKAVELSFKGLRYLVKKARAKSKPVN